MRITIELDANTKSADANTVSSVVAAFFRARKGDNEAITLAPVELPAAMLVAPRPIGSAPTPGSVPVDEARAAEAALLTEALGTRTATTTTTTTEPKKRGRGKAAQEPAPVPEGGATTQTLPAPTVDALASALGTEFEEVGAAAVDDQGATEVDHTPAVSVGGVTSLSLLESMTGQAPVPTPAPVTTTQAPVPTVVLEEPTLPPKAAVATGYAAQPVGELHLEIQSRIPLMGGPKWLREVLVGNGVNNIKALTAEQCAAVLDASDKAMLG